MKSRFSASLALAAALSTVLGCSAGGSGSHTTPQGNPVGSGGETGSTPGGGLGGGPVLGDPGSAPIGKDPNDGRDIDARPKTCDANGVCTCLRLGLLGTLESSSNTKDTKPFVDWLNGNSGGTAKATLVQTKPTIDEAFLKNYDVLVVANVNSWTFSADEKAAVQAWVATGGGIVTLTGFTSMPPEPAATSQLVDFAGMGYTGSSDKDYTAPGLPQGQVPASPIYYKGGTVDLRNCLFRRTSMVDKDAGNTWAIKFMPEAGTLTKLTDSLDYVGAYYGWPVKAPAGSTVIATDPSTSKNMAVALEVDGKGRIFSFGDEWVILANLWQPVSDFVGGGGEGDMCYVPATATEPAGYHSVKTLYQSKQFWYDVINWVAPPSECNFTIMDPDVVVK